MDYTYEEIQLVTEKAQALAREGRWQDVKLTLQPLGADLESYPEALYLLAFAHSTLQNMEPARELASLALSRARTVGDRLSEMKATNLLGIVDFETGLLEDAQRHFETALGLAEALGEHRIRGMIANNRGNLAGLAGDAATARACYEEALAIYRELGERRGEAQTLHNLGIAHRDLGEYAEADRCFIEAARAAQPCGDHRLFATAVVARAELVLRMGDLDAAERMGRAALMRFDVHSSLFGLAEVYKILGVVARERGQKDTALAHFDKALSYCSLHENPLIEGETRLERGVLMQQLEREAEAETDLLSAALLFDRLSAPRHAERARTLLGRITPPN